ncbi:PD-(D/E)XK nuclease family protein [Candidatus Thiosymbion oneisti]|uniref:PD-(D/E)XK nuclease family protein n=1 Tax=Candidatus Thiosymbion oneisti TaxID=589554 RepID=UPI000A58FDCC|nr:DUF3782 domain-containing protein [Candidatus Thiosymbion oneisti]
MTQPMLTETTVRDLIRQELPVLLQEDRKICDSITELGRERFADRDRTDGRIEQMLDELRRDRERSDRKWKEQQAEDKRRWEENTRRWEEQRAEDKRREEENTRKWEENARRWKEQRAEDKRRWEENTRKWEAHVQENKRESERLHEEIMAVVAKVDRSIGALGARWGLNTERSFRDALAAILEKSFGVAVINVNEFDDEGTVFGRPEQVELDVVIHNGILILIEIKSSVSKADMHIFERKARFYERRHERQAQRLIVISPMIDPRAKEVGKDLGIELYADSMEVPVR